MCNPSFSRTALLLGQESIKKLSSCRVAVFGVGGVGSYAVEALARAGVGGFLLVDSDTVDISNINRQLIATTKTVGRPKVEAARERVLEINPAASVDALRRFYLPGEPEDLITGCDYVVDAIDTVSAKIALALQAQEKSIPIISCMGAGNKLDPTRFQVADIYSTSVCPLCRVMRRELRQRGVASLKVVYSTEPPAQREEPPEANGAALSEEASPHFPKRQIPGSVSFVPSVAGLILAGEVVKDLTRPYWPV